MVQHSMVRTMGYILNSDFAGTDHIGEATRRSLARYYDQDSQAIHVAVSSERLSDRVVRISYRSYFERLSECSTFVHKFYFVERGEVREAVQTVDRSDPNMSTELLVAFAGEQNVDYFNVSVCDNAGNIIAADAIVFDRLGRVRSYPFTPDLVSGLSVRRVELTEDVDTAGRPVVRFTVEFDSTPEETTVAIHWEAVGVSLVQKCVVGPDQYVASAEMPLTDNPHVFVGDWVAIAVDASGRFIAQTFFMITFAVSEDSGRNATP